MRRRQLLAATGIGIGGLVTTTLAVGGGTFPVSDTVRLGLAPTVPASVRSDDRASVATRLGNELPVLASPRIERATSEWALLRGLANADFDVVELGSVAGTAALEAGLVEPLVQPTLAGAWAYEGELLATDTGRGQSVPRVAVGGPLATPTHAALTQHGTDGMPAQTSIRWHVSRPTAALDDGSVTFAASDEFHAPPDRTVHRSYSLPVPGLYVRAEVEEIDELREQFTAVAGGDQWYGRVKTTIDRDDAEAWLADLSLPVDPA
jgi:hypothetical protein